MSTAQPRLKRDRKRSREIFERAEKVLVGGVNSPVRAFRSVGGEPLIIERGSGQHLYDADGNELLDFVCSWGDDRGACESRHQRGNRRPGTPRHKFWCDD